jgi:hypothetical protein
VGSKRGAMDVSTKGIGMKSTRIMVCNSK